MTKKRAVITAAGFGALGALMLTPKTGSEMRRIIGRGIWSGMRFLGGNVKTSGSAIGRAGKRAGGSMIRLVRRCDTNGMAETSAKYPDALPMH